MKISNVYSYPTSPSYLTPKAAVSEETETVHKLANEIDLINKQTSYIKENKLDFTALSNANKLKLLDTY